MTFFFETYGCQMNHAESSAVKNLLRSRQWQEASSADSADLVIINTCSVRITAETRVVGRIAHFTACKRERDLTLLVMGCMAERLHEEFKTRFPAVDYVVGMFERSRFEAIFSAIESRYSKGDPLDYIPSPDAAGGYRFFSNSLEEGAFQAYIPIMNGCNNFCSYCIVPYVRGREVSRDITSILSDLDNLAARGVREVTLLGQNVNSYRWQDSLTGAMIDFPALLERIARHLENTSGIKWVRFMSSHPKDLSDDVIAVIARERVFCRYIHLPVQSGSNRILGEMNRRYTREHYLSLVDRIRTAIPEVTISTDILVGFPGETEEDQQQTLNLVETVGYDAAFMYHYNPREGTKAFDMPNWISEPVKKARLDQVIRLQHSLAAQRMRSRVGSEPIALIESTSRNNPDELFGHTEFGDMVVFASPADHALIGRFVRVQLTLLRGRTFRAKIVEIEPEVAERR